MNKETEIQQDQEHAMREAFRVQKDNVLASEDRFRKTNDPVKIGLEVEYSMLDQSFAQASQGDRDAIVEKHATFADGELGAAQIELRTDPIALVNGEIGRVLDQLSERDAAIDCSAEERGIMVLRSGTNPLVPLPEIVRTKKEKYQQVPDFHNKRRKFGTNTRIGRGIHQVDVGDAAIVALCNSLQVNTEATDFTDAVDKLNRSLMIGPSIAALSAGARFIAKQDTTIADMRSIAWEVSHDTRTDQERALGVRTRVGLPAGYYRDMEDYFQQVGSYPFILHHPEAALQIGIGLNWRDTRIKVIEDSLVVEFRPMSVQPTSTENVAASLFYTGRLHWSQQTNERLLPFDKVEHNRQQAMYNGLQGNLYYTDGNQVHRYHTTKVIELELARAKHGLEMIGAMPSEIDPFFAVLQERLVTGTPSDLMARIIQQHSKGFRGTDLKDATREGLIAAMQELNLV